MTISVSSPVTGTAQTGLTSPTYTVAQDSNPDNHAKQWLVTALGGTQTGVVVHTIASPFTIAFWKPKAFKVIQWVSNVVGGNIRSVPKNVYKVITRKGVLVAANSPSQLMIITTEISVPAGAEGYDSENVRAALSAHLGTLYQQSANIGDLCVLGSI